eukprot:1260602-Rhodomonas_salina.1
MEISRQRVCWFTLLLAALQLGAGAGPSSENTAASLTSVTYASGFPLKKNLAWAVHVMPPFAMYDSTKKGREQFTGFVPEMAVLLEQQLNVNFTMMLGVPLNPEDEEETLKLLKLDDDGAEADLAGGAIHMSGQKIRAFALLAIKRS